MVQKFVSSIPGLGQFETGKLSPAVNENQFRIREAEGEGWAPPFIRCAQDRSLGPLLPLRPLACCKLLPFVHLFILVLVFFFFFFFFCEAQFL